MGILPDFFVDEKLRARQDQLDAQWQALYNLRCESLPTSASVEFDTDFNNWRVFYDSESDWSSGSKSATDEWQTKAKEWATRLATYGCGGSVQINNIDVISATGDKGIPSIKNNPADDPSLLDTLAHVRDVATKPFTDAASTVG